MNNKVVYEFFIGLLALMLALMLVIDIFIPLPKSLILSFFYIDNIVRIIFIGDYMVRFCITERKREFIKKNIIDLISIIPLRAYIKLAAVIGLAYIIEPQIIIKLFKIFMLGVFFVKFKIKTKEEIKTNRVYYLLIISTTMIVIGAVIISLIEGISLGDALWWSFVTFTTVGYGDIVLKTQLGRSIAVILMIFGVGFIGITSTAIALRVLNGGKKEKSYSYKNKVLEGIKLMLDNYDSLSDEDIDNIVRILKSLRDKES